MNGAASDVSGRPVIVAVSALLAVEAPPGDVAVTESPISDPMSAAVSR